MREVNVVSIVLGCVHIFPETRVLIDRSSHWQTCVVGQYVGEYFIFGLEHFRFVGLISGCHYPKLCWRFPSYTKLLEMTEVASIGAYISFVWPVLSQFVVRSSCILGLLAPHVIHCFAVVIFRYARLVLLYTSQFQSVSEGFCSFAIRSQWRTSLR